MAPGDRKPSTQHTLFFLYYLANQPNGVQFVTTQEISFQFLCVLTQWSLPCVEGGAWRGDSVPDDGADVGVKLGHQDAGAHDQDVQPQNMEEAESAEDRRGAEVNSEDRLTAGCLRGSPGIIFQTETVS